MKEKLLKKSKVQRNWGIGIMAFAVIGLLGGLDGSGDKKDLLTGAMAMIIVGIMLLIFSNSNKKKSASVIEPTVERKTVINTTNDYADNKKTEVKDNSISSLNIVQSENRGSRIDGGKIIGFIVSAIIVIMLIIIELPLLFKSILPASDKSIIEAAENEAKSLISETAAEIPSVKSEILDEGDDWTLVKVSYKIESSGFGGTFIFYVYEIGSEARVYYEYKESGIYDLEVSEEEIEIIKAQWKLE